MHKIVYITRVGELRCCDIQNVGNLCHHHIWPFQLNIIRSAYTLLELNLNKTYAYLGASLAKRTWTINKEGGRIPINSTYNI